MSRRAFAIATAFVLIGLAVPGPLVADDKVKLAIARSAMLVWIAEENGFFEDEGLDVEIQVFQSGLAASSALLEGSADLSTTAESAFVGRSFEHPDLRVLASISASESARLVGRRDRGIVTAEDLTGRRIGVTKGTTGEFLLDRYLTLNRMSLDSVAIEDLRPADIASALVAGDIDAGLTWEPYIFDAEVALGDNAVALPGQDGQHYYFLLLSKADWIERNPEPTSKVLRAILRAEQFVIDNEEAAKGLVAKRLEFSADYVDHLWPMHSLHVGLPQDLLFKLEETARWRIRKGLTRDDAMPNYVDFIETRFLHEINPLTVGIVR